MTILVLTPAQQALADDRARAVAATVAEMAGHTDGFVSLRDTVSAARRAGVPAPDWRAERDMVRAAGFGRFRTGGVLGDWASMVSAADEAGRWHREPVDLVQVARRSLAWCLAGRPDGPRRALMRLSRSMTSDDVHNEAPDHPTYRQLLDGWREVLQHA